MATFDVSSSTTSWNHSYSWNSVRSISTNFRVNDTLFGLALDFFWVKLFYTRKVGILDVDL
jgi:hypothetical protein